MRGLIASVYRDAEHADTTNGGMSSRYNRGVAIHDQLPEIFEPKDDRPAYIILPGHLSGWRAIPVDGGDDGQVGPMFGGNFLWTADSRWQQAFGGPVPIHDRWETPREGQ